MENNSVKTTRALLGVSDKTGLADLARTLARHGVEIASSGGTKAAPESPGVPVKAGQDVSAVPRMRHCRGETLHRRLHGRFRAPRHKAAVDLRMEQHGLEPID